VDAHGDDAIEALRDVIRASDGSPRHIPPLIRHYLSLNARFIDYHVEREFGNALYCLLRVDLSKAPRPHLRRFIGESAADRLLES
jgi:putative hemolysin